MEGGDEECNGECNESGAEHGWLDGWFWEFGKWWNKSVTSLRVVKLKRRTDNRTEKKE